MNITDVENKGLDKTFFHSACNALAEHPFFETMGLELLYLGDGIASAKIRPESRYSSVGGRVHGGMISFLADNVMGIAAITSSGRLCRTVEMSMNYLAPVFEEKELIAEGYVIHPGKTVTVAECKVSNDEGKLIAKCKGTFIVDTKSAPYVEK